MVPSRSGRARLCWLGTADFGSGAGGGDGVTTDLRGLCGANSGKIRGERLGGFGHIFPTPCASLRWAVSGYLPQISMGHFSQGGRRRRRKLGRVCFLESAPPRRSLTPRPALPTARSQPGKRRQPGPPSAASRTLTQAAAAAQARAHKARPGPPIRLAPQCPLSRRSEVPPTPLPSGLHGPRWKLLHGAMLE